MDKEKIISLENLNQYSEETSGKIKEKIAEHTDNTNVHVTTADKNNWNSKFDSNQGTSNAGKVLGTNSSGDVVAISGYGFEYDETTKMLKYGTDPTTNLNQGIGLDDTLSKTGYAAEASAVGELKSDLDNLRIMYPFDKSAKLCKNLVNSQMAKMIKDSIIDIRLFGAKPSEKYWIRYMNRSNDGNNIIGIIITDYNGNDVCRISEWCHYFPDGIAKEPLSSMNNSGVTGFIVIDWSKWIAGTSISVTLAQGGFSQMGISELCYENLDDDIEILLPSTINWVEGQELSIYFNNIILCNNIDNYQIDCVCGVGKHQAERFVWESPIVGTSSLTINVYTDNYKRLVASATTSLHIISKQGNSLTKKVCLIGDSWTESTWYTSYLQDRFNSEYDTDSINMIGTISPWGGSIRHEGRGGWSTKDYVKKSSFNGKTNAFFHNNTFDFSYYLSNNNLETPDIVTVFLGINDAANVDLPTSLSNFDTIINSIISINSTIKVGLGIIPPPCESQDGFGKNNACGIAYYQQKKKAFNLAKVVYEKYKDNDRLFFIPIMSSVDMLHNVSKEIVPANAYTEETITRLTDNIHCDNAGYQQVADAFYGALKALY